MARFRCLACGYPFKANYARAYCSNNCQDETAAREQRAADAARLAQIAAAQEGDTLPSYCPAPDGTIPCAYCGMMADTLDHVIPQCKLRDLDALGIERDSNRTWTVHACSECNCALVDRLFRTFAERKAWVKGHYRSKYGEVISAPPWTARELRELGPSLRLAVTNQLEVKATVLARLRW